MYLLTVTVPGRATRPRSLRPRSTSITCSARSFGIALELLGEQRVLAGVGAARPRAGDRVGRQPVALDLEQQLRARRRRPRTSGVRTKNRYGLGLTRRSARYSADPVERRAGRRVERQVERLASGEHDLDRLAGRDRVLGDLDRVDVLVAAEARLDRAAPGAGRAAPSSRAAGVRAPPSSAALGRDVRSSASKMAASAIR